MNKSDAGRIGGLTTLLRHGQEHYSKAGKLGGRPRWQQPVPSTPSPKCIEGRELPNGLGGLRVLWNMKRGEFGCN